MSHPIILLKQDHLIVKGHHYTVEEEGETTYCMELDFTIQVNGKMANFTDSIVYGHKWENSGDLWVENWMEWFLIVRILMALWYSLDPSITEPHESKDLLNKWVDIVRASKD